MEELKNIWKSEESAEISYQRLLNKIKTENKIIKELGSDVIPQIQFQDIINKTVPLNIIEEIKKRGVCVIRNVIDNEQACKWANEAEKYVTVDNNYNTDESNMTKSEFFNEHTPQIYGVYWSRPQIEARQHPNMQLARSFMNRIWKYLTDGEWKFDPDKEMVYADRMRIRLPGNISGLLPHVDGGSNERWTDKNFHKFYEKIFEGNWENFDPWDGTLRVMAHEHPSDNVSTVFRTFQGWIAVSKQGKDDGTLLVVPLLKESISHLLLAPFIYKKESDPFCGAYVGKQHKIKPEYHQILLESLISIPVVNPGDTVFWHPDVIHAVEKEHKGTGKSSVFYIGGVPFCPKNALYLEKQKHSFLTGKAGPDFPQENKEISFQNRATIESLTELGQCQMGFKKWPVTGNESSSQLNLMEKTYQHLNFECIG